MTIKKAEERASELRHALNNAAGVIWDIRGITNLLIDSGAMDAESFSPEVRAVVSMVHERTVVAAKLIEEVL
jgi:hypothetical protein